MTGSNDAPPKGKLTLSLSSKGLEQLKARGVTTVKQQFPRGQTSAVEVEVRRSKRPTPPPATETVKADAPLAAAEQPNLTAREQEARMKALQAARQAQLAEAEEAAKRQQTAQDNEPDASATLSSPSVVTDEAATNTVSDTTKRSDVIKKAPPTVAVPRRLAEVSDDGDSGRASRKPGKAAPRKASLSEKDLLSQRRAGKIRVTQVSLDEEGSTERTRSLASVRRAREKVKLKLSGAQSAPTKVVREVIIPETISVQELANRMAERGAMVIKSLMKMGIMATINQEIDADVAELVVAEFGHQFKRVAEADVEVNLDTTADDPTTLTPRPPVVTIMGHVDHGKTSLLDAIRSADVAAHEAGGITQHIGAYQITLPNGKKITFIDTPGHEAFTAMRARGAQVTDIVVLVVAADDGIMPQTIEAIKHAQAANVPLLVAINKIDKAEANAQKVRLDLLQHGVILEAMGGQVLDVEVSAKQKMNLDKLCEAILLQAEVMELKANANRAAQGVVLEARLERGRGAVTSVLVQRGSLRVGDIFIAGSEYGRVRALQDDRGKTIEIALPAMPVEVLGAGGIPSAGDDFMVVANEEQAREITQYRQRRQHNVRTAAAAPGSIEQMFSKLADSAVKELRVVIKSDVQGSIEAITGSLAKLKTNEVEPKVLFSAVGGITESDVTLAKASNAIIIAFNVRATPEARELAKRDAVEIRYYSVIYNAIDEIKALLSGMLAPQVSERYLGTAEIREVFMVSKVGKVAGCMVQDGSVQRGAKVRLLRDNVVIYEGALRMLRRFKDEAKEVAAGFECGIMLDNYQDIQKGDRIECFDLQSTARQL